MMRGKPQPSREASVAAMSNENATSLGNGTSHAELTVYTGGPIASAIASPTEMVTPLLDAEAARKAIATYERLKAAIVQPSDVQKIQGRDFLKKSFWRRVAACFGLSLDLVSETRAFDEKNHLCYAVLYRATAPNGRSMIGDGYCSTAEGGRGNWPEHNVRATAHTRAKNRAISDLVGGGEVSAEEMQEHDGAPDARDGDPPWLTLRADMRALDIKTVADANEVCKVAGVRPWQQLGSWDEYHRLSELVGKMVAQAEQAARHEE